MITEEAVLEVLKNIYDPDIPINILDLGLIYGIDIERSDVHIKMTLTAPHCPMSGVIVKNVKEKIEAMAGVNKAYVELVWDPVWSPHMISKEAMKKPDQK